MELYSSFKQSIEKHADRTALSWENQTTTYRERFERCNIAGNALLKRVDGARQNIALLAGNTPLFIDGLFAILGAGHIAVPLNPLLNPEELSVLIAHSDAKILLTDPLLHEKAEMALQQTGADIELIPIPQLIDMDNPNPSPLSPNIDPDDPSMILYTSGTTGDPKGVILSHHNIYSNAETCISLLNFNTDDTLLCCLPLYHTFAMTLILFGGFLSGGKILLMPQFSPQGVIEAAMSEPSVIWAAVPPMLYMVARFAPEDAPQKHHFRVIASGGGPLPIDVWNLFKSKYDFEIIEGYGLTETSPVATFNRPGKVKVGTIGSPLPGVDIEIRDECSRKLPHGEIGELCVQGDLVMKGYYKNEEENRLAFHEDGWLRTGDMASQDTEGHIKIVGRIKDMIVSGGENIYPREIEETLLRCPGVMEAAVIAKPDRLRSEIPHAFITLSEDAQGNITPSDLRKFCRQHLAEFKVPDDFSILDAMPKTPKGTVEKKELKTMLPRPPDR